MGYDVAAFAVVGLKFPNAAFETTKRTRGCRHKEAEGADFCPKCGREMWEEFTECLTYEEIAEKLSEELKAMGVLVVDEGTDSENTYIGIAAGVGDYAKHHGVKGALIEVAGLDIEEVRAALNRHFNEGVFGIWAVLLTSY